MNPAMLIIIALGAIFLWIVLAEKYKDIGNAVDDTVGYAIEEMKENKNDDSYFQK